MRRIPALMGSRLQGRKIVPQAFYVGPFSVCTILVRRMVRDARFCAARDLSNASPYTSSSLQTISRLLMQTLSDILKLARERADKTHLPYGGALTPQEAYSVLGLAPGARIVDVRTRAELDWVGRIPGAVEIEWNSYPGGVPNPHFLVELRKQVDPESLLLFICRSGARSHSATMAASADGFTACYNVLEGFEGDKDIHGHRGKIGGWRQAGLPWLQS